MDAVSDEPTFSVGELNLAISEAMVEAFPRQVWVRGEIQQYHASRNQHVYFELVEKDGNRDRIRAALRVALFRNDRPAVNRALKEVPGVKLTDGVEVRIRGRVDFYPPTGRLRRQTAFPPGPPSLRGADRGPLTGRRSASRLLRRSALLDPIRSTLNNGPGDAFRGSMKSNRLPDCYWTEPRREGNQARPR